MMQLGPGNGGPPMVPAPPPLGRCTATNASLKTLIAYAYGVNVGINQEDLKITGGPSWIGTTKFDIEAKAESTPVEADLKLMLQALLADQFKLQIPTKPNKGRGLCSVSPKGGPKLKESVDANAGPGPQPGTPMANNGGPVMRGGPGGPGGRGGNAMMSMTNGQMTATLQKATMATLVNFLSSRLGGPVVDKTDLKGTYDMSLTFSPEGLAGSMGMPAPKSGDDAPVASIFTAIQDQLGLKLEAQKVPIETIVIDRAEKPPQN